MHETEASNAALKARVKASESKENAMRSELAELRERARDLAVKNGLMQHDIAHLTSALSVRHSATSYPPGNPWSIFNTSGSAKDTGCLASRAAAVGGARRLAHALPRTQSLPWGTRHQEQCPYPHATFQIR